MKSALNLFKSIEVRDLVLSLVGIISLGLLFSQVDAFEQLYSLSRSHEHWQLDEILLLVMLSPGFLIWLLIRRWQQALFENKLRLKREYQLRQQATHDSLTQLPNRVLLEDRLNIAQARSKRANDRIAVMVIDVDNFKAINDEYGVDGGNIILRKLALRFAQILRSEDTLARFGGDEFAAVLWHANMEQSSLSIAQRLLDVCHKPIMVNQVEVRLTASIGITFYPLDAQEQLAADQLLRQADQALYQAKITGKNRYAVYDSQSARDMHKLHAKRIEVTQAIACSELVLHYQPQINIKDDSIFGVEALVRWQHPDKGLLAPNHFLPAIENHSLSIDLGEWVISTALIQIDRWQSLGERIKVSVNISALHIQQSNFVERLELLLNQHHNVDRSLLRLEITESGSLGNLEQISKTIQRTIDLGISFALDDFGTGYSSLTYLHSLPTQLIKIDRSFVCDILEDEKDERMVRGIISLAKTYQLPVIAEGVESSEQRDELQKLGCDLAQGYLFSKALAVSDLEKWIEAWHHIHPSTSSKIAQQTPSRQGELGAFTNRGKLVPS